MRHSIYVVGEAKPQPRARCATSKIDRGKRYMYTPTTGAGWKYQVTLAAAKFSELFGAPICKPCQVDLTFFFERPRSHWVRRREYKVISPKAPIYKSNKPDRDNLDKLVLDALTCAGVFSDDAVVVAGTIIKKFCTHEPPGCLITIDNDVGPIEVGEIYTEEMLDLSVHPRRIPGNALAPEHLKPCPGVLHDDVLHDDILP